MNHKLTTWKENAIVEFSIRNVLDWQEPNIGDLIWKLNFETPRGTRLQSLAQPLYLSIAVKTLTELLRQSMYNKVDLDG